MRFAATCALLVAASACAAPPIVGSTPIPATRAPPVSYIPAANTTPWHDAPPAPLAILEWLDQRDAMFPQHVILVDRDRWHCGTAEPSSRGWDPGAPLGGDSDRPMAAPTWVNGLVGDAQLEPLVEGCYRRADAHHLPTPDLRLVLDASAGPLVITHVDPVDAPLALVTCAAEALLHHVTLPADSARPITVRTLSHLL